MIDFNEYPMMSNEEYREKLLDVFKNMNENYKLRWFYIFITEKLKMDKEPQI